MAAASRGSTFSMLRESAKSWSRMPGLSTRPTRAAAALELAQASRQEFSLEHGGLFFRPYFGTSFGNFDFSGTLVDGARQWAFKYDLATEKIIVQGTDAPGVSIQPGSSGRRVRCWRFLLWEY